MRSTILRFSLRSQICRIIFACCTVTYPKDRLLLLWAPNKRVRVSPTMRTLVCSTEISAENDFHEWDNTKDTS